MGVAGSLAASALEDRSTYAFILCGTRGVNVALTNRDYIQL